jgi:hypothetical protein
MQILISLDGNCGNDDLLKMPDIHPIRQTHRKKPAAIPNSEK